MTALETRNKIEYADSILQGLRWELLYSIISFTNDDVEQIKKVTQFLKAKSDEIINTVDAELRQRKI
jgi:hypothetical protein